MVVYVVTYNDWEGSMFHSVWSTAARAEAAITVLNLKSFSEGRYSCEDIVLDDIAQLNQ